MKDSALRYTLGTLNNRLLDYLLLLTWVPMTKNCSSKTDFVQEKEKRGFLIRKPGGEKFTVLPVVCVLLTYQNHGKKVSYPSSEIFTLRNEKEIKVRYLLSSNCKLRDYILSWKNPP